MYEDALSRAQLLKTLLFMCRIAIIGNAKSPEQRSEILIKIISLLDIVFTCFVLYRMYIKNVFDNVVTIAKTMYATARVT